MLEMLCHLINLMCHFWISINFFKKKYIYIYTDLKPLNGSEFKEIKRKSNGIFHD